MRIFESVVKYSLLFALLSFSLYILSFQFGYVPNETVGEIPAVNGYTLLGCLLIAALFSFISPMWDVGKYLNTQKVEDIAKFIREERREFGMLVLGFFAAICLCSELLSFLWWIGAILLSFFFVWFFCLRK